jgi:hypothetical protein
MNALLHAHLGRELVGWLPRPLVIADRQTGPNMRESKNETFT